MKKSPFLIFLAVLTISLVSPTIAASVIYENNSLIVAGVPDDGIGLGAFDIVLLYPEDVQVSGVTLSSPFSGAVNDQQDGMVILAGFQVSEILTGDVPVASLTVTGDPASLDIRVRSLLNQRSDEIPRTNADYAVPVTPTEEGPEDSDDSAGIQTPGGSEDTTPQTTEVATSGPSVQEDNGDDTGGAPESDITPIATTAEEITVTTGISASEASTVATQTSPQKSPLSCSGIFISICVAGLICWRRHHNTIEEVQ
ncbi:hypothetical protein [Methanofollis fontis]|uniref:hypothetical protein n=1 Tax=Methanofollis fontis TaxID=2052832 RepID=UPI00102EEDCC|nr:hypothetical protein [Methanofollis fontis]